jgi:ribonuclease E
MAKEICISTTPHETRLAILEDDQLAEIYYERENEYTLAGSIYKGRVTRVLPGMQSSFVDVGLERDAFLYVTDFLEDQPDGEEYETSSAGNGRRGDKAEKQEKQGAPERAAAERPAADRTAAEVPAGDRPAGEGSRREGRRRGRGNAAAVPAAVSASASSLGNSEAEKLLTVPSGDDLAEKEEGGEDSPEGTRRWRGRRGRRRGGVRAGVLGSPAQKEGDLPRTAAALFALPEHGAPGGLLGTEEPASAAGAFSFETVSAPQDDLVEIHGAAETPAAGAGRGSRRESMRGSERESGRSRRTESFSSGSSSQAITLPGEALSKYGQTAAPEAPGGAAKSAPAAGKTAVKVNYVAPKPASLVEVGEGWDGGAVLPGESLALHRTVAAAAVPLETAETFEPAMLHEPVAEATAFAAEPAAEIEPATSFEAEPVHEAATESFDVETTAADTHEEPHTPEYEPEDGASATRPTPPHTQELRISQLFGFGDSGATEKKSAEQESASEHTIAATEHFGDHEMEASDESESHFATEVPAAQEPVSDNFTEMVDQLHGKGATAGYLEEEIIDEDEYDFDPIHAHADEHDLEELEEETMHGGEHEAEEELPVRLKYVGRQQSAQGAGKGSHAEADFDSAELTYESGEDDDEGDAAAFSLEEVEDGEESESLPAADGEPARRERGGEDRGRRSGRNGARRGRTGGGGRRQSAQTQDLPIISDLLKQGQEILVQIAKEPIAKKGARITSHIALPGRFLVFMPTVNHVGVSRKIESDGERQRLKRILISEKGESAGGFIVRTAADGASEEELRADLRFLISLWTEIKQRADTAKAPALIYHDLNLVERILRDQVSSNFSAIWVDTEQEYERIVRFLSRFQPALVRRVKLYTKETPLFEHFGITEEISKALKSKVWLKSGGSIVINQTEALVAIDINTGKYVGKTARLEDTIVKTNLDAIPEIVRQIRLRDLGGIIVIDFIDMDERRNRNRVLQALEEAMKVDRAPSKVLQFNDFGLVAITRKRVKQSLERTLSVTCEVCSGTGMVKGPVTVCNEIYIELRKMQKHLDGKDVMLRVHPEVVKQLKGGSARWINEYEEMLGKTIIIKSDPSLHPEQFDIH